MLNRRASLVSVVLGTLVAALALTAAPAVAATDVRLTQGFYADTRMSAAKAAKSNKAFASLASAPQAFWVTDYLTVKNVRATVRTYADLAVKKTKTKKPKTPIVTIYGIPNRDCGGHSGGGLTDTTYPKWIDQIALGLKGKHAVAILEPDALAMLDNGACANELATRGDLLRYATKKLNQAGVWVYLDAGHSGWVAPATMAARLKAAGVTYARGFSTNVANFNTTTAETTYGNLVVKELTRLGYKNKRFVVDTSRNGGAKGAVAQGEYCNPKGARIGARPKLVNKGSVDFYLWVKNPGESDGPCNDGPAAGQWWPTGAKRLLQK